MGPNKLGCTAVVGAAILGRVRSCEASCFHPKPRFADGIIHARCAPLARQELQLYSMLCFDDH